MSKLQIHLLTKYKSFTPSVIDLSGNLIILSGVNGSGKTQLVDIIKGYEKDNPHSKIERHILIDNILVEDNQITHKSFRDYNSLGELTPANVSNFSQAKDQIMNWYNQTRLHYNPQYNAGYQDVVKRARNILVNYFGEEKINLGHITREDLNKAIPSDFIAYQDDIFTNKIGEIFWNYTTMVYRKEAEAGRNGEKIDRSKLPIAPWKILNDLFTSLDFGYRFKDEYYRVDDEISDQPAIYPVDEYGKLVLNEKRMLYQLSDGEKALISLTFAILATEKREPQILLLDEYDAPLNPSLTESFFKVLNTFFVDKGIKVIVVTHSSATLSLAPDNAQFHEVYRPNNQNIRILQVDREQYEDLRKVNKRFYDKIADQQIRLQELKEQNDELSTFTNNLKKDGKLQIVSEGNNIRYIEKAITVLAPELLSKIEIIRGAESSTGKQQMKAAFEVMINCPLTSPILFIWDVDAENSVANLMESEKCKKYCFQRNESNAKIQNGIENLFSVDLVSDDLYDVKSITKTDGGTTTTTSLNKPRFEHKVMQDDNQENFLKFTEMISLIRDLVV